MQQFIFSTIHDLKVGSPAHYQGLSIYPLFRSTSPIQEYEMLRTAFHKRWVHINEISEGGSVPELKLINESDNYILILDGEELEGAKQNRVLNTSLLVPGKSQLIIPVSCTEQGRWSRISPEFKNSEKMLFSKARVNKMETVHKSLKQNRMFHSNQGEI